MHLSSVLNLIVLLSAYFWEGYALIFSINHKCNPSPALIIIFGFCCKSMVLSAALIEKTENKCSTYFQGITVHVNVIKITFI